MSQPAKAQEPSMEEILASIRRIIADDDTSKPVSGALAQPAVSASGLLGSKSSRRDNASGTDAATRPSMDVLELTEKMQSKGSEFHPIDGAPDVVFNDPLGPDESPLSGFARSYQTAPAIDHTLLSPRAHAAVDTAFNSLAHTVLVQNARTLEDLVREMLKPMLKGWLDDNLPSLVERLVRAEIERVSRGRG
jgi:cell pole-organizing protein PopZ